LADDLKSAATDALKKACSLLGIGLHLYGRDDARSNTAADRHVQRDDGPRDAADRLSPKQLAMIWTLSRQAGLTADTVRRRSLELFGDPPERLDRSEASALITRLTDLLAKRRAA
jgi:hypothetical protein